MRVLIAAESFLPAVNGVTNSVLRILDHLDRTGHHAAVIAPAPGPTAVTLPSGTVVAVERVPGLAVPNYRPLTVGVATDRRIAKIIDGFRPDVVHLAAPVVLGQKVGRVAERLGVATVALFQTDLAGFASSYHLGLTSSSVWRWLRRLHNRADLTLAPTGGMAAVLRGQGFRRVGVWGRGVDHAQFNGSRRSDALRHQLGATDTDLVVGYVGRLAAEKQIERLASLSWRPGIKLVIVGDGPDRERLERMLPTAHFTGFLSGDLLGQAVASLDVFVHTGQHDTYCQALQEAMAAGVAVIGPDCGGPADLIDHARTGLLYRVGRPGSIEACVNLLQSDPQLRRQLGVNAAAEVSGRSWSALGDELLDYYQRAAGLTSTSVKTATAA
jgi:phosphatidylinositol alpha 1,6-mannosyltransferase